MRELWRSDGTGSGTSPFTAFAPEWLAPGGSNLFMTGADPQGNDQLWVTDGTAAPRPVAPFRSSATWLTDRDRHGDRRRAPLPQSGGAVGERRRYRRLWTDGGSCGPLAGSAGGGRAATVHGRCGGRCVQSRLPACADAALSGRRPLRGQRSLAGFLRPDGRRAGDRSHRGDRLSLVFRSRKYRPDPQDYWTGARSTAGSGSFTGHFPTLPTPSPCRTRSPATCAHTPTPPASSPASLTLPPSEPRARRDGLNCNEAGCPGGKSHGKDSARGNRAPAGRDLPNKESVSTREESPTPWRS